MLAQSDPGTAALLLADAERDVAARWKLYEHWAAMPVPPPDPPNEGAHS
jgi:hypothetical protein